MWLSLTQSVSPVLYLKLIVAFDISGVKLKRATAEQTSFMQTTINTRSRFTADILPGLTTAAVVVPKALAYATIAQLPVQAGLYAALVPMAIYAVLGSSRLLSVSTTTPIAILCAVAIGEALRNDPASTR